MSKKESPFEKQNNSDIINNNIYHLIKYYNIKYLKF